MIIHGKICSILNNLIRRGYWFNNVKFKDCSKFWNYNTFNTDIVNLGSTSAVCAFDYSGIPMKCANWALSTNPLVGDLAILKNYVSYLKKGATVIIPLCPFSSLAGRYGISEDRYYSVIYPSALPDYSYRRHCQIKMEMQDPLSFYPLMALLPDLKNILIRSKQKEMTEQEMENDATNWMNNWMKEFSIVDFSYPLSLINNDAIDDSARYLNEMVSFCKERDIRTVVVIPPVYHTLADKFTPIIHKMIIDSLVSKIEDESVRFHNYMDDSEFCNNRAMFINSFLLNQQGARAFTKKVLRDIQLL